MNNLLSLSQTNEKDSFLSEFSSAQRKLRLKEFSIGILPDEIWKKFALMPTPFAKEFWIVEGENGIQGRIGASLSAIDSSVGYFGFFEVKTNLPNSENVAQNLIQAAENWLKKQGVKKIFGPINFNTWFPYRFRVDEDQSECFTWEPVNPLQYHHYFQRMGYGEIERYHSQGLSPLEGFVCSTRKVWENALQNGFTFQNFNSDSFMKEGLTTLYQISMVVFQQNFLFEPIPEDAFRQLYVPIMHKLDLSYSYFVLNSDQKPVGFSFCFEDKGYIVFKSIAVHPEARGHGLSNALFYLAAQRGVEKGFEKLITALVRSGAQSESYSKKANKLWQHDYVLLQKQLN